MRSVVQPGVRPTLGELLRCFSQRVGSPPSSANPLVRSTAQSGGACGTDCPAPGHLQRVVEERSSDCARIPPGPPPGIRPGHAPVFLGDRSHGITVCQDFTLRDVASRSPLSYSVFRRGVPHLNTCAITGYAAHARGARMGGRSTSTAAQLTDSAAKPNQKGGTTKPLRKA